MPDPRLLRILEQLRASRFADVKGARFSALIPVSERLLNDIVQSLVPPGATVKDLYIRPQAGNRLAVRARAARLEFLPPVTIALQIEGQPQLPDTPLVLRIVSLPGLLSMAGSMLSANALPPGIRLDRDRVLVDVRQLLERNGAGEVMAFIDRLHVGAEDGRLVLEVDLRA